MNAAFEDWPWAMPAVQPILTATLPDFHSTEYGRFDLTDNAIPDDLLHDLTFPSSSASLSKPYQVNQSSFDIDEDMFSCLDDFILYPDEPSEELRLFDSPPRPRREDIKAGSQLSPVTSFDDSCSSPATSHIDSLASNSPRGQDSIDEDRRKQPKGRRRRNTTVFPCTLCDRICYTSVEARRHHARHVKPFRCPEAVVVPLHLQPVPYHNSSLSRQATASSPSEGNRCEKGFATKNELERHRKSVHYCIPEVGPKAWFKCPIEGCKIADRLWPRRDNLLVHVKQAHPESIGMELRVFIPEGDGS